MSIGAVGSVPWWKVAVEELGQAEKPGADHNTRILEYLKATDLPPELTAQDETPWCSAFVSWCLDRAGVPGLKRGKAWARNWLEWGRPAWTEDLKLGCVVVLSRGTSSGHVGFLQGIEWEPDGLRMAALRLLGGNQGNMVSVQRFPADRLLGIRVPDEYP